MTPSAPHQLDLEQTRVAMRSLLAVLHDNPPDGEVAAARSSLIRLIAQFFLAACGLPGESIDRAQEEQPDFIGAVSQCIPLSDEIASAVVVHASRPEMPGMCELPELTERFYQHYVRAREACKRVVAVGPGHDFAVKELDRLTRLHRTEIGALAVMSSASREEARERFRDETQGQIDEVIDEERTKIAENELAMEFASRATECQRSANWFLAAATGVAATLSAAILLVTALLGTLTLTSVLIKIAAGLPFAVLAAYLLRESSHHRDASRAAAELAVRLRVVGAFADLEPEHRQQLRREFGMRVFLGTPPAPVASPPAPAAPPAPEPPAAPNGSGTAGESGPLADAVGVLTRIADGVDTVVRLVRN